MRFCLALTAAIVGVIIFHKAGTVAERDALIMMLFSLWCGFFIGRSD